jgi:hypothetical protein
MYGMPLVEAIEYGLLLLPTLSTSAPFPGSMLEELIP